MSGMGRVGKSLLSVYVVALLIFLYAPLLVLIIFAFNAGNIPTLPIKSFSTKWFNAGFHDSVLTGALVRSAIIATVCGVLTTLLGVMASVTLAREHLRLRWLLVSLILLPLVIPYIVLAVGLLIMLHEFGIQTSLVAVLAGHVVLALPYSVLVILPRLRTLDPAVLEAAKDLGSSDLMAFWLITLPLLGPSLLSSFLISFTISFDEFAIASFLAPPGSPTYPVFLYSGARTPALLPEVIAVGSIVIVLSLVLVGVAEAVRRYAERRGRSSAIDLAAA